MKKDFFILIVFNLIPLLFFGQGSKRDSLHLVLNNSKISDTVKINTSIALAIEYCYSNLDSCSYYSNFGLNLTNKLNDTFDEFKIEKRIAVFNTLGFVNQLNGHRDSSIFYYDKALIWSMANKDTLLVASYNFNIGYLNQLKGDIPKSIDYTLTAVKGFEILKDTFSLVRTIQTLGKSYELAQNDIAALNSYERAIALSKLMNNNSLIANSYSYLSSYYKDRNELDLAFKYAKKSYQAWCKTEDQLGQLYGATNLSSTLSKLNMTDSAIYYAEKAYTIALINQLESSKVSVFSSLSTSYYKNGQFTKARQFSDSCNNYLNIYGSVDQWEKASKLRHDIFLSLGDYKQAYQAHMTYLKYKDSLASKDNFKKSVLAEAAFKAEKDSLLNLEEKKLADATLKAQQLETDNLQSQRWYLYTGIFILLFFGIFMFNRFRVTSKQKNIIDRQRIEVEGQKKLLDLSYLELEQKNTEILDSIEYAKRIQKSFLASKENLDKNLNEYFVFFQPKDVVSGDFYWARELHNGEFVLSCADSTGHGVPGAIMSILNITSIEAAVKDRKTNPADIFNHSRDIIIKRLKKDGSKEGGKDGMDASLIAIPPDKKLLKYCAANNPIWIVRQKELIEIKPEKMPVGKHDNDYIPFAGGEFEIQKGDMIYLMTDGFQDQFGGEKGKKYKVKPLKNFILSNSELEMSEQNHRLEVEFDKWKGDHEQIDDVCFIGIRI